MGARGTLLDPPVSPALQIEGIMLLVRSARGDDQYRFP